MLPIVDSVLGWVETANIVCEYQGQNTPRSLPVFVDSNGHPVNFTAPAPVPAEKPKLVVQGAAYMSMVVNELHEEGKIEFSRFG